MAVFGSPLFFPVMTAVTLFVSSAHGITQAAEAASPPHTRAQDVVGETVADRPSPHYRFETHELTSADGKRRYRIQIAIPKTPPAPEGPAALYMLDGNAAMDTLTDNDLASLAERNPPVLVAIGYDVPTRNDVVSRAYDYTPPVFENGQRVAEPVVRGRIGGGADIFLQLIQDEIKPLLRSRATLNQTSYLWGHSYGGLFAMHVLFSKPDAFSSYIVGDPSAWWHDGALVHEWEASEKSRTAGKHVAILVGTKPRPPGRPAPDDVVITTGDGRQIAPRTAVREMADGLKKHGAKVHYQEFPEHGHGDMIRASLEHALHIASEP